MFGFGRRQNPMQPSLQERAPLEAVPSPAEDSQFIYFLGSTPVVMLGEDFWDHGPEQMEPAEQIVTDVQKLG